jgi:hypothetical protein
LLRDADAKVLVKHLPFLEEQNRTERNRTEQNRTEQNKKTPKTAKQEQKKKEQTNTALKEEDQTTRNKAGGDMAGRAI